LGLSKKKPGYEEATDDEKKPNSERAIEEPCKCGQKSFGESVGDDAVRSEHEYDAYRSPTVDCWQSGSLPAFWRSCPCLGLNWSPDRVPLCDSPGDIGFFKQLSMYADKF
jgi:hypothetical protein